MYLLTNFKDHKITYKKLILDRIKTFFNVCHKDGIIPNNITEYVHIQKPQNIVKFMKDEEIDQIKNVDYHDFKNWINNVYACTVSDAKSRSYIQNLSKETFDQVYQSIIFCLRTGLRKSDLESVTYRDIDDNKLQIIQQKTQRILYVPLLPTAIEFNNESRPKGKPTDKLFNLPRSSDISRIQNALEKYCNMPSNLDYRMLRRSFACYLTRNNVTMSNVAKLMGHSNTATTQKYYADVDYEHVLNSIKHIAL
jgi:integrase